MLKVAICDDEQKDIDIAENAYWSIRLNTIWILNAPTTGRGRNCWTSWNLVNIMIFLSLMWKWRRRMEYISPQLSEKDTTKMQLSFCKQLPGTYGTELFCACI